MRTYPSIHLNNYTKYPAYILISHTSLSEEMYFKDDTPLPKFSKDRTSITQSKKTKIKLSSLQRGTTLKQSGLHKIILECPYENFFVSIWLKREFGWVNVIYNKKWTCRKNINIINWYTFNYNF